MLLGRPVHEVQKIVGHSDLKTTQKYVRLAASDLKGATDPIDLDLSQDVGDVIDMSHFRT